MQLCPPVLRRGPCLLLALFVSVWAAGGAGAGQLNTLAGSEWGFAGETDEHARYLRFDDHGEVGGMLGCNRFRGHYSFRDGELRIGPLANTLMACPGPMMEREKEFLTMLEETRIADARRRKLILKDADGETLAELVRRGAD
ncbi:META domain-containing protein [Methyloceanibacter sp.]|uniref:META domain-containing protein n=1 Tax=Methyloceanibacter sp. TaxID=1965321 RepID=UPI002BF4CFF1|nr:META domain-containing protein [Methyloceanibacter sp.]HML93624.1 META domain-containing protein [Methyloceanibacter sp.]